MSWYFMWFVRFIIVNVFNFNKFLANWIHLGQGIVRISLVILRKIRKDQVKKIIYLVYGWITCKTIKITIWYPEWSISIYYGSPMSNNKTFRTMDSVFLQQRPILACVVIHRCPWRIPWNLFHFQPCIGYINQYRFLVLELFTVDPDGIVIKIFQWIWIWILWGMVTQVYKKME